MQLSKRNKFYVLCRMITDDDVQLMVKKLGESILNIFMKKNVCVFVLILKLHGKYIYVLQKSHGTAYISRVLCR